MGFAARVGCFLWCVEKMYAPRGGGYFRGLGARFCAITEDSGRREKAGELDTRPFTRNINR